jgi:CPA1 family monovalent cation:H+ antiporter
MALFQSVLILLLVAILLLQVSRRLLVPYPTMLAIAGCVVAALPWAPTISLDPHLVMALFIAPAILDAAYEFPLRAIQRYWPPLLALAVMAVLITTAAVAYVGVKFGGLPLAAAVALGAIVSPPDAAAAAAMFKRSELPRSTETVLRGESLLNDAVALFIFGLALRLAEPGTSVQDALPQLALAVPGGLLLGWLVGHAAFAIYPMLSGTLGGILFQFVATFGIWIVAERLGLSAILAVVAVAMTAARQAVRQQSARDRMHSDSVWSAVVFLLNVLAFLFVGLQARGIILSLSGEQLGRALTFGGIVLATVIVVRIVWALAYNRLAQPLYRLLGRPDPPSLAQGIVASWCGMRGMVTLATALALPANFPGRDLILLSALMVVLGTLVIQGLTLRFLIRLLRFPIDHSRARELAQARSALAMTATTTLDGRDDDTSRFLAAQYRAEIAPAAHDDTSPDAIDALRLQVITAQRARLATLRNDGAIDEETYHLLQKELDLCELAAQRKDEFALLDS